ncbi:glycosyltransferase family 2 protein [Flavobacteriales bacterium]|nr:glycosyltransferase family 2 protein [Flavobacteriales bacterium]
MSIVIPAYNEASNIEATVLEFFKEFKEAEIPHEILVVNDNSTDSTLDVLEGLLEPVPTLRYVSNDGLNGFGYAVRYGLSRFTGDCVALVMADLSDDPKDAVAFYRKLSEGYDCVFGTRWSKGGKAYDYPKHKLVLNRLFNTVVRIMFGIGYDDCTNAFKMYRRKTIVELQPFLSPHFNLTLEIPLKAIVRGYSYAIVPNSWRNRTFGESNLKIKEMGGRYAFILIYCWIEKFFVRDDYKKAG